MAKVGKDYRTCEYCNRYLSCRKSFDKVDISEDGCHYVYKTICKSCEKAIKQEIPIPKYYNCQGR